jgi:hypothetical protein
MHVKLTIEQAMEAQKWEWKYSYNLSSSTALDGNG